MLVCSFNTRVSLECHVSPTTILGARIGGQTKNTDLVKHASLRRGGRELGSASLGGREFGAQPSSQNYASLELRGRPKVSSRRTSRAGLWWMTSCRELNGDDLSIRWLGDNLLVRGVLMIGPKMGLDMGSCNGLSRMSWPLPGRVGVSHVMEIGDYWSWENLCALSFVIMFPPRHCMYTLVDIFYWLSGLAHWS